MLPSLHHHWDQKPLAAEGLLLKSLLHLFSLKSHPLHARILEWCAPGFRGLWRLFISVPLSGLNAWLTTDFMVPFLPAHWAWDFANPSKQSASAGKAQTLKSSLSSVADLQGDGFVLQRAEAACLALLCCSSVGSPLKIIPGLPEKETVYLVHAKLNTADKCN